MNWNRTNLVRLLGATVLVCALVALWVGCKGSSSPNPSNQPAATSLPILHARPASSDLFAADPLTSDAWRNAPWQSLSLPLGDTRPIPPTRAALMYAPNHLYAAFVCSTSSDTATADDTAELWLDTSASRDGKEFVSIIVNRLGAASVTWYRTDVTPQPKDDGTPDYFHPFRILGHYPLPGLRVKTAPATADGRPVWTATFDVPLDNLPLPLQTSAHPGASWRANLIRTNIVRSDDTATPRREILQANFAPVQPGAQSVAPYRMAELTLDPAPQYPAVAIQPTPAGNTH